MNALGSPDAIVYFEKAYYQYKKNYIYENFNPTQFVDVSNLFMGVFYKKDRLALLGALPVDKSKKSILAIPLSGLCDVLVRYLLKAGVNKDDIILTVNMPSWGDFESYRIIRESGKFDISGSGKIFYEIDNKKILCSSYDEISIIQDVFYNKCYDFSTPHNSVTVIDVGANTGIASLFYSTKENVQRIYAFEPFVATYEAALENIALNEVKKNKITLYPYGLSNENKELIVLYNDQVKGCMSTAYEVADSYFTEKIAVQVRDVAEVFAQIFSRHDKDRFVIKMDCEGAEYEIFDRLDETGLIKKIHILIMEWHNKQDNNVSHIESILMKNSFDYHVIGNRNALAGMIFATNAEETLMLGDQ